MARVFTLGQLVTRCQQRIHLENSGLIGVADTSEWKALVSAAVAKLHSITIDKGAGYFKRTRTITTAAETNATATMVVVAKASIVNGEVFSLNDGNGEIIFEFRTSGLAADGNTGIDISGDTTATNVGDSVVTAVNAATHDDGSAFAITASNAAGTVTLTHDLTGEESNQVSWHDVADTGFSLTDMTGGGETYRIPSDHLATLGVYYVRDDDRWEPLVEYSEQEYSDGMGIGSASWATQYAIEGFFIRFMPLPPASQTYKLRYVPNPPDLANRSDAYPVDVITPDGEEFVIAHVAVNALAKEDSQVAGQLAARSNAREEIEMWATKRSITESRRVQVRDTPYDDRPRHSGYYLRGSGT